jgi:hypothetical protein
MKYGRQYQYANAAQPAAAAFGTLDENCCSAGNGAAPAASAQEHPSDRVAAASSGAGGVVSAGKTSRGRGGCRCWVVALVAVVVIGLVARSS